MRPPSLCVFALCCVLPQTGAVAAAASPAGVPQQSEPPVSSRAQLVAQIGHSHRVQSIDFSEDGRYVATADTASVRLWETETAAELRRFQGAFSAAFSPDARHLLTAGDDGAARLWETATGRLLREFRGHEGTVRSVAFSSDGRQVATGGEDRQVRLWDAETGRERYRFEVEGRGVSSVAFSPDGTLLLAGVGRGDYGGREYPSPAILWSVDTGSEIRRFPHSDEVTTVAFSRNGRLVLTAGEDHAVRIWDTARGRELRSFAGPPDQRLYTVFSAAFSPVGASVILGAQEGAFLWNPRDSSSVRLSSSFTTATAFSPDGRSVMLGDTSGGLSLGPAASWTNRRAGRRLRTPSPSGVARNGVRRFGGRALSISGAALMPDQRSILLTTSRHAHVWQGVAGAETHRFEIRGTFTTALAISPDGTQLLTGNTDGSAYLWDIGSGKRLQQFQLPAEARRREGFVAVAFSPDGRYVLGGTLELGRGEYGDARLWDAASGREVLRVSHRSAVNDAAFSPDGRFILTGSSDWTAVLWDAATGSEVHRFHHRNTPQGEQVDAVAFSHDGRLAATAGTSAFDDGSVRLWEVASGREILRFETLEVIKIAFSRDGRQLATGSRSGRVELWDSTTGQRLRQFTGHSDHIRSILFLPDGPHLLTGGDDYTARVWDLQTGDELARLIMFENGEWAVTDRSGRYDASNAGDIDGLQWVVGLEAIRLSQLKERYYEPRLLAKVMGLDPEPLRDVSAFEEVALYPEVEVEPPAPGTFQTRIRLSDQGGGIGRVQVLMNGREIAADARGRGETPSGKEATLVVHLPEEYFVPGQNNIIEVKAYNADGYLVSRGQIVEFLAPGSESEPPRLWAVVAGVSDYAGSELDLSYAAEDAIAMSRAIRLGANRLFGPDRVDVRLLTTAGESGGGAPTKANLRHALDDIASRAKSTDLLIVYLAGHGVIHGGVEGDYYYLTAEAGSANLEDPAVRAQRAVSSEELTAWVGKVPALKQVLVLDTCAAGQVVKGLGEDRNVPASQVRALERLKDRTGLFVLAGSASDAVSYEASRYGQGLLTYSLLLGMRGAALREDEFVDVGRWFDYAVDQVPQLARDIGGIQRPLLAAPRGAQSFDVGHLTALDREQIQIASPKALVLRAAFQDEDRFTDHLGLGAAVNAILRQVSARGSSQLTFVEAAELPGAYSLVGRYRIEGEAVRVTFVLSSGENTHRASVSGQVAEIASVAQLIAGQIETLLNLANPR